MKKEFGIVHEVRLASIKKFELEGIIELQSVECPKEQEKSLEKNTDILREAISEDVEKIKEIVKEAQEKIKKLGFETVCIDHESQPSEMYVLNHLKERLMASLQ